MLEICSFIKVGTRLPAFGWGEDVTAGELAIFQGEITA